MTGSAYFVAGWFVAVLTGAVLMAMGMRWGGGRDGEGPDNQA